MSKLMVVLTSIQEPTACVRRLAGSLASLAQNAPVIVMGDRKGPARFDLDGCRFYPLAQQRELPFSLARVLPDAHYARKNLGYLQAIQEGAQCIYETDDDNAPNEHWRVRTQRTSAHPAEGSGWLNVYRLFTDQLIWPRGFPLDLLNSAASAAPRLGGSSAEFDAPIQQGLADGSPDVDAVWRLVLDRDFTFERGPSVYLRPGTWCPFNSQTTWWWPVAYPLLYLPYYCSFRMTDIWRGFVAQRCLWALGLGMVFHAAEVVQERNVHNLMRDFKDEVPGYLNNAAMCDALAKLDLKPGASNVGENLRTCYEKLVAMKWVGEQEMGLVDAWLKDLAALKA